MSELVRREPNPVEGRIVAPGTAYRGTMAIHEAPPYAVQDWCPMGECEWRQIWDTIEELNDALVRHVRDDHGECDPEDAILAARIRSEVESRRRNRSW